MLQIYFGGFFRVTELRWILQKGTLFKKQRQNFQKKSKKGDIFRQVGKIFRKTKHFQKKSNKRQTSYKIKAFKTGKRTPRSADISPSGDLAQWTSRPTQYEKVVSEIFSTTYLCKKFYVSIFVV